jgi:tetratricopeptide (TPR) repeat protein
MKSRARKLSMVVPGVLLVGSMVVFNTAPASPGTPEPTHAQQIKEALTAKAKQEAKTKGGNLNADAVTAIKQVEQAASLLESAKYDDAVKKLKSADKKLETAMASDPALKLMPVVQDVMTYDLLTSPKAVKDEVNAIVEQLKSGNVQGARVRLDQLRSELISKYVFLPVEVYPAAIKQAIKEIDAKRYQQAEESIEVATHSLVEEVEVMPLPVALAQDAILDAEAKKSTDRDQALWDLDYAHEQLLTAERLGYFYDDMDDYKDALQHIENLREVMGGKSTVDNLFTKAKNGVKQLVDKFSTRHPAHPAAHGK